MEDTAPPSGTIVAGQGSDRVFSGPGLVEYVPGQSMVAAGMIVTVLGAVGAGASFLMKTTVDGGLYGTAPVVNLGLLQQQAMIFQAGLAIALFGTLIAVGGAIVKTMNRLAKPLG